MPALLLQATTEMYKVDEYILMDGDKRAYVHLTIGVKQDCPLLELSKVGVNLKVGFKQGCPLPPFLFSLYINDMGRDISEGTRGAITGDGVKGVSYMLFADDMSLTTNNSESLVFTYSPESGECKLC
eukprot:1146655-Pelagomonas_calceolata.AAC.1